MFKNYHLPTVIFGAATMAMVSLQPSIAALSSEQIADIAKKITVRIVSASDPGSGIIIGKNGNTYKVLTARHVIEDIAKGEQATVTTVDGQNHAMNTKNIQTFGKDWDLAVVEFTSNKAYQVGQMGDSATLKEGKTLYVAGFPLPTAVITNPLFIFKKGDLTAVASRPFDQGYGLVYDNQTLPGMSGGAVLDENGKIVGVHDRADGEDSKATADPNIRVKTGFNLAIPINSYLGLTNQIAFNANAKVTTPLTVADYFIQANQKSDRKDYQGAIALYNQSIAINPQSADTYINRGKTYYNLQKYPEAIADYNQAIAINPQYANAYHNRGAAYSNLQKYQEAMADYNKAIQLNPQSAAAYINRGLTYKNLQRYPEAIADYNKAIQLNPQKASAYYNRGNAYDDLKKYPEAIADYTKAIQLNPQYADTYIGRGAAYFFLDKYPEARRDWQQAANLYKQQGNNDIVIPNKN